VNNWDGTECIHYCKPVFISRILGQYLNNKGKLIYCGKNISGFDVQFLKKYHTVWGHRHLDIGSVFWKPGDTHIKSLQELCELYNITYEQHTALGDCLAMRTLLERKTNESASIG